MLNFCIIALTDTSDPLDAFTCEQCDNETIATTLTIPLDDDNSPSDDSNDQIPLCDAHCAINAITLILTQTERKA